MNKDENVPLDLLNVERMDGRKNDNGLKLSKNDNGLKLSRKYKGSGLNGSKKVIFKNNDKGENTKSKQKQTMIENKEQIIANATKGTQNQDNGNTKDFQVFFYKYSRRHSEALLDSYPQGHTNIFHVLNLKD